MHLFTASIPNICILAQSDPLQAGIRSIMIAIWWLYIKVGTVFTPYCVSQL